jgi:hypothetical protein
MAFKDLEDAHYFSQHYATSHRNCVQSLNITIKGATCAQSIVQSSPPGGGNPKACSKVLELVHADSGRVFLYTSDSTMVT